MALHVLFCNREPDEWLGGDAFQVRHTMQQLEALGVRITFTSSPFIDPTPYDLVHLFHLNYDWTGILGMRCRELGVPYVISAIYYPEMIHVPLSVMGTLVNDSVATIALSPAERDEIVAQTGADAARISIIPNGIDPAVWQRGRNPHGPALSWSRVVPDKGIDVAARACQALGIPYHVYGPYGSLPEYEEELRGYGAQLMGEQEQAIIAAAAREGSVYIGTSWTDRQSLAVLEAAHCGLPIVDSIYNRGAGLLPSSLVVDPADIDAVQAALLTQRAAPDNHDRVPTWPDIAAQVLALYQRRRATP